MAAEFSFRQFFGTVERFQERFFSDNQKFDADIFSLTMSQQRLLRELSLQTTPESEGVSLKSLADDLNLSSSAVSVMVEMLVQKNVLERRSSETDRRQVLIRLSDRSWEAVCTYDKACQEIFSSFSDAERELLVKIAGKFADVSKFSASQNQQPK